MKRITFLLTLCISLYSCESEKEIAIGQEFIVDSNPITITQLSSMENVINHDSKSFKSAPKDKRYVYFEVENKNDKMIFLSMFSETGEIENVNANMYGFGHKVDSGFNDAYYLINKDAKVTKVQVSTAGGEKFVVNNPQINELNDVKISNNMQSFISVFNSKGVPLIEGAFSKFINGNAYDLVKEVDNFNREVISPTNIRCTSAIVTYVYPDGKTYDCSIRDALGGNIKANITWTNDKITKAVIQWK